MVSVLQCDINKWRQPHILGIYSKGLFKRKVSVITHLYCLPLWWRVSNGQNGSQWRIQDGRGAKPQKGGGVPTYYFGQFFPQKN